MKVNAPAKRKTSQKSLVIFSTSSCRGLEYGGETQLRSIQILFAEREAHDLHRLNELWFCVISSDCYPNLSLLIANRSTKTQREANVG